MLNRYVNGSIRKLLALCFINILGVSVHVFVLLLLFYFRFSIIAVLIMTRFYFFKNQYDCLSRNYKQHY